MFTSMCIFCSVPLNVVMVSATKTICSVIHTALISCLLEELSATCYPSDLKLLSTSRVYLNILEFTTFR